MRQIILIHILLIFIFIFINIKYSYIDDVTRKWPEILICNFRIGNNTLDTLLFADEEQ